MIKTTKPIKYDESIDSNIAMDCYVIDNYAGLPNVYALEELWKELPPAIEGKPLKHVSMMKIKPIRPGKPIRFFQNRFENAAGLTPTGKILNGVLMPSGLVFIQWLTKVESIGIFRTFDDFYSVHVALEPDANEIVFLD